MSNESAFPYSGVGNNGFDVLDTGMTLRDYFAAAAVPALIGICGEDSRLPSVSYPDHVAGRAYEVADAMLAEKRKGETT